MVKFIGLFKANPTSLLSKGEINFVPMINAIND